MLSSSISLSRLGWGQCQIGTSLLYLLALSFPLDLLCHLCIRMHSPPRQSFSPKLAPIQVQIYVNDRLCQRIRSTPKAYSTIVQTSLNCKSLESLFTMFPPPEASSSSSSYWDSSHSPACLISLLLHSFQSPVLLVHFPSQCSLAISLSPFYQSLPLVGVERRYFSTI